VTAVAALDIQTGRRRGSGRGVDRSHPTMAATEWWPPNVAKTSRLLHPRGLVVVADPDQPPLPFADQRPSDQPPPGHRVVDRDRTRTGARVTYFAQHLGPATVFELVEYFLRPQPEARAMRHPDAESADREPPVGRWWMCAESG
jgi:hypothetical protein